MNEDTCEVYIAEYQVGKRTWRALRRIRPSAARERVADDLLKYIEERKAGGQAYRISKYARCAHEESVQA